MQGGGSLGTHPRWRPRSTSAPIGSVSPWDVYLYMSMVLPVTSLQSLVLPCKHFRAVRPCMTWTVYRTMILSRLPTLVQPALLFDYPECLPPALILSPNSDFDSALTTLCLKLVIEFCLFDLHSVLIKLHMDPNATDSSLQVYSQRAREENTGILTMNHLHASDWSLHS